MVGVLEIGEHGQLECHFGFLFLHHTYFYLYHMMVLVHYNSFNIWMTTLVFLAHTGSTGSSPDLCSSNCTILGSNSFLSSIPR